MKQRCVLIHNPIAGRWRWRCMLPPLVEALRESGFSVEACPTSSPGDATDLAAAAASSGARVVFVAAGDGTLREAAVALAGTDTALAPLPLGTTNVVARALGIPLDPLVAARRFGSAQRHFFDVGLCGVDLFLMQTSAGLDARVLSRVAPRLKRLLGRGAVGVSALGQWLAYSYPEIELLVDGRPTSATFVAACNIPYYAGSFRLAPDASYQDRRLDLVLFRGRGRAAALSFAADLARGRHIARRDVELRRVEEVELLGPAGADIQVDGDWLPVRLPLTVGLARRPLTVLAP